MTNTPSPDQPAEAIIIPPDKITIVPPDKITIVPPDKTAIIPPDKTAIIPPDKTAIIPPDKTGIIPPDKTADQFILPELAEIMAVKEPPLPEDTHNSPPLPAEGFFPDYSGQQGRHPKKCICKKCQTNRIMKGEPPLPVAGMFADVERALPPLPPPADAVDYEKLAGITFDLSTNAMVMFFGDEWKPSSEDERKMVCVPLAVYLRAKQVQDLPPGVLLAVVISVYAAPRIRQPNTAGKLKAAWGWLTNKFNRKKPTSQTLLP